jgi:hypothetical protein
MHIYHDIYAALPPPANYNKEGKPLLSWRVHVLPFIEQEHLYKQFKLDEPWDSEHNKKLIKEMPGIYRIPSNLPRAVGIPPGKAKEEERELMELENYKTSYLVPTGERTLFPKGKAGELRGVRFAQVVDGTSNTIMIVEAAPDRAVIWTKPDDWEFNPDKPSEGLMGYRAEGCLAAMGDASVRTIRRAYSPDIFKALFTRDGGEVVDLSDPGPKKRSLIPGAAPPRIESKGEARPESRAVPFEDSSVKPAKRSPAKSPKQ